MSALVLARMAIPLIIGAAIGYAVRDAEADDSETAPQKPVVNIRQKLKERGETLLAERTTFAKEGSRDIEAYLKQTYLGLFYIGRAGRQLKPDAVEALAGELQHLHHLHKPRKDKALVGWYETVGIGHEETLAALLSSSKVVTDQNLDPRYIAYALGVHTEPLSFDGILEDILK